MSDCIPCVRKSKEKVSVKEDNSGVLLVELKGSHVIAGDRPLFCFGSGDGINLLRKRTGHGFLTGIRGKYIMYMMVILAPINRKSVVWCL